ncbi:nucleotidyltransferase domain-containing protein [Candidatus Woesearchaeota archaeon]|nr:nucleotidyltransferase domain-containing protein [Candidatus Woesearchaeota archaeon]
MFLENIVGAASRVKILRTLTEVAAGFTLEELEKETNLSRGIIHKEVRRLVKASMLVEIKAKGKLKAYRININHPYYSGLVSLFGEEKLFGRKNVIILKIWNTLESLTAAIVGNDKDLNIVTINLFGSHARGTAALTSDVDLLIVLREKTQEHKSSLIEICKKYGEKAGISINPVFMTAEEYKLEFKRKTSFIDQMNRSSIALYFDTEKLTGGTYG